VYVLDLVGFGGNRGRFVLDQAAEALKRWMDETGMASATIFGHSMGGLIACELAADYPSRVERLVLVDAAAWPLRLRPRRRRVLGAMVGPFTMPLRFHPVLVADAWRAGPRTTALRQLEAADVRAKLDHVHHPALAVWGARDTLVPVEDGRLLTRALPNARFEVIRGAGHNPMWDRPLEFNRLALEFLAEGQVPSRSKA
jgi:pimeloyl-ACP methyl ester carboxylesterase